MEKIQQIKYLREKTGLGLLQCKNAIEEAGGDMEKALRLMYSESQSQALPADVPGTIAQNNETQKEVSVENRRIFMRLHVKKNERGFVWCFLT